TAEHFVDDGLHVAILVARMALLEGPPVIAEDLLEGVFVDPLSVVCHGRWLYHTLPPGSTCLSSLPCAPPWSLERGEQGQQKRKFLYTRVVAAPRAGRTGKTRKRRAAARPLRLASARPCWGQHQRPE